MTQEKYPFSTNLRKVGLPFNVKHPYAGVAFILILIGAIIGFWLGRMSVKLIGP
ncbi:hypothetical protein HYW87_00915 [Candidatus Roizmanbacteria bacterium]|nr:hypothetical protein [Candidatus Roizmanbacteria bacterium]